MSRGLSRRLAVLSLALAGTLIVPLDAHASTTISNSPLAGFQTNGRVSAIVVGPNGWIYFGGTFTSVIDHSGRSHARMRLAAIDQSGNLTAFNPKPSGAVRALATDASGDVLVGGDFTAVGGIARGGFAEVSRTGTLVPVTANTNASVYAIAASGATAYLGGSFTTVRGRNRMRLAKVNTTTGALAASWTPASNNIVRAVAVSPGATTVYVGGAFTKVGSSSQNHLASLSAADGTPNPWKTHPTYALWGLAASPTHLYAAGAGGGGHLVAFNSSRGTVAWTIQTDGNIQAVALAGNDVIGAGHFTNTCELNTNCANPVRHGRVLAVNASTGVVDPLWNPQPNSTLGVFSVAATSAQIILGGDFTQIGTTSQQHLAQFPYF